MNQKAIPCLFMRGGTSRGLYFNRDDLPDNLETLAQVLISAVGAGHPLNIDGIGGGNAVTTKVAMLSKSTDNWAEVDYFFAQVSVEEKSVDFSPTCGNILSGIGPAAIEMGLLPVQGDKTVVKIHSVNTSAMVEAVVETPNSQVNYAGEAAIDGVPGTAAPIVLNFMNVIGSKTGALFPTGTPVDTINGIDLTCIDVAMPMVIGRAKDFGVSGYESQQMLDENKELFAKFEPLRIKAGEMMGLGDVTESVVPKFGLLAPPKEDGAIAARYFMPWRAHPAYAVTGSICTGSCILAPGTVAEGMALVRYDSPTPVKIEHPTGSIDVIFDYKIGNGEFKLKSAGLLRTARKLFSGNIHIPTGIWDSEVNPLTPISH